MTWILKTYTHCKLDLSVSIGGRAECMIMVITLPLPVSLCLQSVKGISSLWFARGLNRAFTLSGVPTHTGVYHRYIYI